MNLMDKYDNSTVRRRDRLLEQNRALELLMTGEYGFLALGGESGYGIPINFVLSGESIYFHCAPEGEKLRRIARSDQACFCVVGHTAPQPAKFTTEYESVLVFGPIDLVENNNERMRARTSRGKIFARIQGDREQICRKIFPSYRDPASGHRTHQRKMQAGVPLT